MVLCSLQVMLTAPLPRYVCCSLTRRGGRGWENAASSSWPTTTRGRNAQPGIWLWIDHVLEVPTARPERYRDTSVGDCDRTALYARMHTVRSLSGTDDGAQWLCYCPLQHVQLYVRDRAAGV